MKGFTVSELILDLKRPEGLTDEEVENRFSSVLPNHECSLPLTISPTAVREMFSS
jgi:hypothetical protein